MLPIYLASASPRRRELMEQLGLKFTVVVSNIDENKAAGEKVSPGAMVEELSLRKAGEVARDLNSGLVIGSDTVVVWRDRILGKPRDRQDAVEMLNCLQGDGHWVFSGLAVINAENGKTRVSHEKTRVFFRAAGMDEIKRYVDTGEPMDKAGAYAIQGLGSVFVKGIEGCYFNVVGLPLARLASVLKDFGVDVLSLPGKPELALGSENRGSAISYQR